MNEVEIMLLLIVTFERLLVDCSVFTSTEREREMDGKTENVSVKRKLAVSCR